MSELRQDRTTGRWVVIAPNRGLRLRGRPLGQSLGARPGGRHRDQPYDAGCPFCPGHEAELPGIISETALAGAPRWAVRVVPNKFPALHADATTRAESADLHRVRPGYGFHEVIIESPRHDADLALMTDPEIEAVVLAYRDRSRHLLHQPGIAAVVLFRNRGPRSGATLAHPHAQAIALGLVPPALGNLMECGQRYYDAHGRCATCDEIEIERMASVRVVEETAEFLAAVPFAATSPGEIWIVPKRHQSAFVDIGGSDLREFAHLLRGILARLQEAHDDPPYNFVIDSAGRDHTGAAHIHWRLRIVPQLTTPGGFELGAGMAINPSSPEDDAAVLRNAEIRVAAVIVEPNSRLGD